MAGTVTNDAVAATARRGYYDRIGEHEMAPLRETLQALVTPQPNSPAVPHIGTPAGVGPIVVGDEVTGGIDGIGTIRMTVTQ